MATTFWFLMLTQEKEETIHFGTYLFFAFPIVEIKYWQVINVKAKNERKKFSSSISR